jgi:UDP-N-acetylglucosamine 1-carboxyvinyltransferase
MEKFIVTGGKKLIGTVQVSGAKNVALKAMVAACLTRDEVIIHNIPLISDISIMAKIIRELGGKVTIKGHTAIIRAQTFDKSEISLDEAAQIRTSSMFIAPLLIRNKQAIIPNPGGCRLGARPIDRTIRGLEAMGAHITYDSDDGYFHATTNGNGRLHGATYRFDKPTHTGTETLLIAAACAKGTTVLENCALEPEIDELIGLLNLMGARIKRKENRVIEIEGVDMLHGTTFSINPDRNEIVTFAIVAVITKGDIFIKDAKKELLKEFIEIFDAIGGGIDIKNDGIRFFYKGQIKAVDMTTAPYPGFMTDWQAPWGVLMTQADGESIIHETVFENKLGYINDLKKMGAKVKLFNPPVANKEDVYNFNLADDKPEYYHAVKITGPNKLHNAVLKMRDLRAGAAVVIAALASRGVSTIFEIDKLDRGYEKFEIRLQQLGADIQRVNEEE